MMNANNTFNLFRLFNLLLIVIVLSLGGYFVFTNFVAQTEMEVNLPSVPKTSEKSVEFRRDILHTQGFGPYRKVLMENDLFLMPWEKQVEEAQVEPPKVIEERREEQNRARVKQDIERIKQKVKVVGLLTGDHPQVIMEDKQQKETVFMNIGDNLDGAVLRAVEANSARFDYQGETFELMP